jgi:hypothetical protein
MGTESEAIDSERLRPLEELYHSAMERAAAEREAFLKEACGGDSLCFFEPLSAIP